MSKTDNSNDSGDMIFDHIAQAVPNIEDAVVQYENTFGISAGEIIIIEEQKIKMATISIGNIKIELMEPLDDQSPIAKFLLRNPNGGLHHYCLAVDDVNKKYENQKSNGVSIISEPTKGYHGRNLYFIHPKQVSGALIEVEEREK